MNEIVAGLKQWGCKLDDIMEIFQGDEGSYLSLVSSAAEDGALQALGDALKKGDIREAFENAHMLKGVLGNLGLTPSTSSPARLWNRSGANHWTALLTITQN